MMQVTLDMADAMELEQMPASWPAAMKSDQDYLASSLARQRPPRRPTSPTPRSAAPPAVRPAERAAAMTGAGHDPAASFPRGLDASLSFGPDGRSEGQIGQDVLAGLISGIDGFLAEAQRKPGFRTLGPAMLGRVHVAGRPRAHQRIAGFPYACVLITKQPRDNRQQARVDKLKARA